MTSSFPAAKLRELIDHPIVDGDGHVIEYRPALDDYMRREGLKSGIPDLVAEPQNLKRRRGGWMSPLTLPAQNTRDLATASFPRLLYSRLDELGIDFAIIYPTIGQFLSVHPIDDVRRASCRAENNYLVDAFGAYPDRLCPVAVVPMGSPAEAIEELDFAVGRGFKTVMIAGHAQRPTPGAPPELIRETGWLDTFGIDSEYDYDPFWARCEAHGVSLAAHAIGMGFGTRRSPSNYVYNQIGHFASTGEALAKSLFLGGVPFRFPKLRFAFLEGGAGWATALYSDLVNRWEKRNKDVLPRYYRGNIDIDTFSALLDEYAPQFARFGDVEAGSGRAMTAFDGRENDFALCGVEHAEDIKTLFADRFYFGCEADDPTTKLAFDTGFNPFGAELRTIFSSDIGHWDVADMREVLGEAYELVERGWIDRAQFRDFTFQNAIRLHGSANPLFFRGSVVETPAAAVLAAERAAI